MNAAPAFDERFRATFVDLLRWRRDVRHFRTDPLEAGVLEGLVADAALAPSVGYSQPWRFVNVEDAARRTAIVTNFERANATARATYSDERRDAYARLKLAGLREAPVHLAVFADTASEAGSGLGRATMPQTLEYSVVGAVCTLWLLARARGIGVGWVSILDPLYAARALEVPEAWSLVAYLCLGYPAEHSPIPELQRERWQLPVGEARTLYRR